MKNFLLLLLIGLVIGEVSGNLQVGVPATPTSTAGTPEAPQKEANQNGPFIFAIAAAILLVVTIIFIRWYTESETKGTRIVTQFLNITYAQ